jgi:N-acetylmuramoyl-L-alanine amidase
MIALLAALVLGQPGATPSTLTVSTPRGEVRLAVRYDRDGAPVLVAATLARALNGTLTLADPWANLTVARQSFRFLLDSPYYVYQGSVRPLAGPASVTRDTLFIPFQFVVEVLPRILAERFRYDADASRLVETGTQVAPLPLEAARLPNGLMPGHVVTVDAGHGGTDPGNPGLYFPSGVTEKHITLQLALLVRT